MDGEKILSVIPRSEATKDPPSADVIDATGLLAIPGAIDAHVHFDTPGFEDREDFAHGTRAAAAGGVTTVIDMPDTCMPPVTSVANLENKLKVIERVAYVDFALWGGVSQNSMRGEPSLHLVGATDWFADMEELWKAGVVAFKTYMISGMDTFRALSFIEMGQVMQYARKIGALVGVHAEEGKLIAERMAALNVLNKNKIDDYYASRAEPAEKDGIALAIGLARETKARVHIVHVASGQGANLIAWAKSIGVDISAETCPHYLAFTKDDFKKFGSLIKTAPVIKESGDRSALWQGLADGSLDFIATDHAPAPLEQKKTGNAWKDYGGIPGVELMLPFAFSEGYKKKKLTLTKLIEVTSTNAAKRFGLFPQKGTLAVGSDADIVLINPKKAHKIDQSKMHSKAKWTPFNGQKFAGKIVKTILRGKVIYSEKGDVAAEPQGKWIKRNS